MSRKLSALILVITLPVLFILAWWYTYHLRANVQSRIDRGLLPGQHPYSRPEQNPE